MKPNEQYCSYVLANALINAGMDVPVGGWHVSKKDDFLWPDSLEYMENWEKYETPTCTHQLAKKWLFEEKHIYIGSYFDFDEETRTYTFYAPIFNIDTNEYINTTAAFSPEDADEGAMLYILEILLKND